MIPMCNTDYSVAQAPKRLQLRVLVLFEYLLNAKSPVGPFIDLWCVVSHEAEASTSPLAEGSGWEPTDASNRKFVAGAAGFFAHVGQPLAWQKN